MKKVIIYSVAFLLAVVSIESCKKTEVVEPTLVGQPGDPRFNLVFNNQQNVDLDLHVIDPKGEEIYYYRKKGSNGVTLDVDCLCGDCPNGPNENIFWPAGGTAPKGTYKFWVEYYETCRGASGTQNSEYTIRVAINEKVKATYTGTMTSGIRKSLVYTWEQP
jgi:uncharacterized protein YfaP (DUF2135 family)